MNTVSARERAAAVFALLLAVASASTLASCFSEHSTGAVTSAEACGLQLPPEAFGSTIVVIRNFAFSPANVSIRPGTKVTWVNCETSSDAHTSTSDAGTWSSALLAPGESYTREFASAGSNPYHCAPHPGMKGTVNVE